jgi:HEAT repeat protein
VRDGKPLTARSKASVPDLIKLLEHDNPKVRRLAVEELGKRGPSAQLAIPALIKMLQNKDEILSRTAVTTLDQLGKPDRADVPLLRTALQDKNERVRTYAAAALGKLGNDARAAVPELIKALQDSVPLIRQYAAQSLGKVGADAKESVVRALTDVLKDEDKGVRLAAAEAMTLVLSPLAAADLPVVLEELLGHKDVEAREHGVRALGQLRAEAAKVLPVLSELCKPATAKRLRLAALASLAQLGPAAKPALPVLVEALKDSDAELRQAASLALAKLGPAARPALAALAEALKDSDRSIRQNAVISLGKIGPEAKDTAPALGKLLLQEKDRDLRLQIVIALGEIGNGAKKAVPDLVQAFADEELEKELSLITQVKDLGPVVMPKNPQGNPQGNPQINQKALNLLLTAAVNKVLKKLDREFQEANVAALTKIGKVAAPDLIAGLQDKNTFVRWGSIKALAKLSPLAPAQAKLAAPALWNNASYERVPDIQREAAETMKLVSKR